MNPKSVVKASKALLGGTAVLSVASFLSGIPFSSAALINVASVVSNVAISMTAANLGEFAKRLGTGKNYLKQLLADKACLLVLDDVWNVEKARWFDVLGERGQLLITTRDGGIVSALGAFPADTPIPEAAVLTLWRREDYRGRDLLATLARKALLFRNDGQVSLHDVQQDYLSGGLPPGSHDGLLAAYQEKYSGRWHEADDGYFWQNAVYHFGEAGRMAEFARLLWDFRWLQAKLLATDTNALLADFGAVLSWKRRSKTIESRHD